MSHNNDILEWAPECIKCGVGPSGYDCALLNGFCEHFTKNDDSWREYIRNSDGTPYTGDIENDTD